MTIKYTVEQIMKWNPCYARENVKKLIGDGKDATELSKLDIPRKDHVWVLIRMLYDVRGKNAVVDFAGNCALRAYYNDATDYADYAAYATAAYATAANATAANAYAAADAADYADYCTAYAAERQWQIDYLIAAINMA